MSAVAHLLLKRGLQISGCDLKENDIVQGLRSEGVTVWTEHSSRHLEAVDTLVYSSAIPQNIPEIKEAKRRGIRLMKRAEILAYLMEDKTVITVTGMHGKTTTASLASCLLSEAGLLPTVAVGGIIQNLGGNALLGEGRFFVAEADESDGTFLYYHPDYSIITNIDYEHLDYYKNFNSVLETFGCFINQTRDNGCLYWWRDDIHLTKLLKGYKKKALSFGLEQNADVRALNITPGPFKSEFDFILNNKFVARFKAGVGGRHNILNSLPVIGLGLELGISLETVKSALINYKGTRRRLQIKFESPDYLILDDYGHHPTEIKATLETIKLLSPKRLLVIFQPHRYTRTKLLLDSFGSCFDLADRAIITDIYPAGEPPIDGISGRSICEKLESRKHPGAEFLHKDDIVDYVLKTLNAGDVVLVLGAGDITKISDELAAVLKREIQDKRTVSGAYQF